MADSLERARARIQSDASVVVVEAAAGCGKTHEAVESAVGFGKDLDAGQQVLLLTHTNSARETFARRLREAGARRLRMQTLDSFSCEIARRYARHLGLPERFRPGSTHLGHPSFPRIQELVGQLLADAPAISEGLAWKHPVVLVDEHQDSTAAQHAVVEALRRTGRSRVRYFGDGLQRIFGFGGGGAGWDELAECSERVYLTRGRRWDANPELGEWLSHVRECLLSDREVSLASRPPCVHVHPWTGQPPMPQQKGPPPELVMSLQRGAIQGSERTAVLVRTAAHALGLARRLPGQLRLYEASDTTGPSAWLEQALEKEGNPSALAEHLGQVMSVAGTGVPPSRVKELADVCTEHGIELGRRTRIRPLAQVCEPLYERPTAGEWLRALRAAVGVRGDIGWKLVRYDAVRLLYYTPSDADDLLSALQETAEASKTRPPPAAVMTIHRAKGAEFPRVVLPYVSGRTFDATAEGARLLYVALTRAQQEVHLMVSTDDPCPWFVG